MNSADRLLAFIEKNPTPFQVVESQARQLKEKGFRELHETGDWQLEPKGKYFVRRNGSSLAAFVLPENCKNAGFSIMASHSDSPALKIKEHPEMTGAGGCTKLNVEAYGGGVWHTWIDRPLSVAGRVTARTEKGFKTVNVNIDRDLLMIPGIAIHMNRDINKSLEINVQRDMLPLLGMGQADLSALVAEAAGIKKEDLLSSELYLYSRVKPCRWGAANEFVSAPRLDDLACAFCSLEGLLSAENSSSIALHIVFDNEEVGSSTKQGAASDFLVDILSRINECLGGNGPELSKRIAGSFMLSADNAHAVHPSYPEKCDPAVQPRIGNGVVLKFSAAQKYTTDAESAAICRLLARRAGINLQDFVNRSDMPGGSTLGNISSVHVPVRTADIGLPQLSMHSCYETCGAADAEDMIKLAKALFESSLECSGEETVLR